MLEKIVRDGRRLVTIIDPHMKATETNWIYKNIKLNRLAVLDKEGTEYVTECWPGDSVYYDFLNPKAQSFVSSLYT